MPLEEPDFRYRLLFEEAPLPTFVFDRETLEFLDVNKAAVKVYGYSRDEFLAMTIMDIRPAEDIPKLLQYLGTAGDERKSLTIHRKKNGELIDVEVTSRTIQYNGRRASLTVASDLTGMPGAQRLTLSNEVLNTVAAIVLVADAEGRITYASPSVQVLGYHPSELLGDGWWNLTRPDERDRRRMIRLMADLANGKAPVSPTPYEDMVQCKDGSRKWVLWQDSAKIHGFVFGVGQDITERKLTEEALAKSEARLRRLVESNVVGVSFNSTDGRITEANDAFLDLVGYSREDLRSAALRWDSLTPPEFGFTIDRALEELKARGMCAPFEKEYFRKDGSRVPVLLGVALLPGSGSDCISVAIDLTERKRLERERKALHDELLQSHKMEAVGQLAGGIAHDFNNILSVIGGYTELMINKLSLEDPLRHNADKVFSATRRAANLTAQLLAFSRKQMLTTRVLNLNSVVREILDMLRRLIREDIQLTFSPAYDLYLVCADKTQIEQVIVNLIVNARDAMPEGGQLRIETGNVASASNNSGGLAPGEYASLIVSDTGFGMDEATLKRIFEPFFTTKEIGHGTGLGLSTVYGIVKQSGGDILVDSAPGSGSTFRIYFPRTLGPDQSASLPSPGQQTAAGGETVLLVEDEDDLRDATGEYLEGLGYRVLTAKDGEEALEISASHTGPIQLLVTDVVMPRLGGPSVRRRLLQSRPGLKTIFISGYTDQLSGDLMPEQSIPFLQKPFALRRLGELVRNVADS